MYAAAELEKSTRSHFYDFTVQSLLEKGSSEINEDVLFECKNLFGVFDGATSLGGPCVFEGATGGLLAAKAAADAFSCEVQSLKLRAQKANSRIRQLYQQNGGDLLIREQFWSTSCAVVQITDNQLEYCQSGDALILFIMEDGHYRFITPDIDIDRKTLQLWKSMAPFSDAPIYQLLAEQIRKVRLEMNIRYGVLNGEPEALDFLCHGYENLDGVSDILLFTDGLHIPRENPAEAQLWHAFVALYLEGGLEAVRNHVRHLQRQDPQCRIYPRFKLHDDIAAIAIRLG